mmetsp:Transcript_23568/g.53497  ORF Transcript_23568/g.53497 Transcript_23568/m.53497 type:complete len:527 (+) Transcript_23568:289-1869(+)
MSDQIEESADEGIEWHTYDGGELEPRHATHVKVLPSVTAIPSVRDHFRFVVEVVLPHGLTEICSRAFILSSLRRIELPDTLTLIGECAFEGCESLERIDLPKGLRVIERETFKFCRSLRAVGIPPSVERIGALAFYRCHSLASIDVPDSVKQIEHSAFEGSGLRSFRMPRTCRSIESKVFWDCRNLYSIEIHSAVATIKERAFEHARLRNIAIPKGANSKMVADVFRDTQNFQLDVAFPYSDGMIIFEELKGRFSRLPIHRACYFQGDVVSYVMESREEDLIEQDCLGFTPLHILVCSTTQNVEAMELIFERCPGSLTAKDAWGENPIFYALVLGAPIETLDLLVGMFVAYFPEERIDWRAIVTELMTNKGVLKTIVERLLHIKRIYRPDEELITQNELNTRIRMEVNKFNYESLDAYRLLVGGTVECRLGALGVPRWADGIRRDIAALEMSAFRLQQGTFSIYGSLDLYERAKEGATCLELALWRMKVRSAAPSGDEDVGVSTLGCRFNCGANIVIPLVLGFLVK